MNLEKFACRMVNAEAGNTCEGILIPQMGIKGGAEYIHHYMCEKCKNTVSLQQIAEYRQWYNKHHPVHGRSKKAG